MSDQGRFPLPYLAHTRRRLERDSFRRNHSRGWRDSYLIKDRLSFMRFLELGLADAVPDANTIWAFREALKQAGAVEALFERFDQALRAEGFLAMGGQIVDATIVGAPKQRNTVEEKAAIREGRVPEGGKAKPLPDGSMPAVDLAVPAFG